MGTYVHCSVVAGVSYTWDEIFGQVDEDYDFTSEDDQDEDLWSRFEAVTKKFKSISYDIAGDTQWSPEDQLYILYYKASKIKSNGPCTPISPSWMTDYAPTDKEVLDLKGALLEITPQSPYLRTIEDAKWLLLWDRG